MAKVMFVAKNEAGTDQGHRRLLRFTAAARSSSKSPSSLVRRRP